MDLAPAQLTERLRASRALPSGRVTAVHPGERRTTILSTIVPLRVEYSPDAPSEAPTRLLLKASRDGLDPGLWTVGEREVAFYREAAPLMPEGPLPRCYDAECASGRFHLLLEDLSDTHVILTEWPIPPPLEACERIVDTWATFHAFWWKHPSLGSLRPRASTRPTPSSTGMPTSGTSSIPAPASSPASASSTGTPGASGGEPPT